MKKIISSIITFVLSICMALTFVGCGTVNELGLTEKNAPDMVTFDVWVNTIALSGYEHNRITLNGEGGSEFVCSISSGDKRKEGFLLSDSSTGGVSVTVASGSTIYWRDWVYVEGGLHHGESDRIWIEIINQKNNHIIGYAVVRVDKIENYLYEPTLVKSVTFPRFLFIYQNVTEEQVATLMANAEKDE